MLRQSQTHTHYQSFVKNELFPFLKNDPDWVAAYTPLIAKLWLFNLDPARAILTPLYAPNGAPAWDPLKLVRALVAMTHLRIPGVTRLVRRLRIDPLLRLLCEFDPHSPATPGVGTFYDFFNRLWLGDGRARPVVRRRRQRPRNPGAGQKLRPKHPGVLLCFRGGATFHCGLMADHNHASQLKLLLRQEAGWLLSAPEHPPQQARLPGANCHGSLYLPPRNLLAHPKPDTYSYPCHLPPKAFPRVYVRQLWCIEIIKHCS